jgi:hypothetical protein
MLGKYAWHACLANLVKLADISVSMLVYIEVASLVKTLAPGGS